MNHIDSRAKANKPTKQAEGTITSDVGFRFEQMALVEVAELAHLLVRTHNVDLKRLGWTDMSKMTA